MGASIYTCAVYVLRLETGKHFYIGATNNFGGRLRKHARKTVLETGSSFPTKTYGFSGKANDTIAVYPCETLADAYVLEQKLIKQYTALCPDTAIFGGGVHFNTAKALHPEERRSYLQHYAGF